MRPASSHSIACDGALVEYNIVRGARTRCDDYAAGIWPLYSRAVNDGAELVIGPLQKDAVAQLLRAEGCRVHTVREDDETLPLYARTEAACYKDCDNSSCVNRPQTDKL